MTQSKREPFAVISYCIEADENALSVGNQTVAGDGKHGFDHVALVDICKRINAAHEARVKEEIEAMRLKTIRMCADKADRMGSEEIRNAILFETLPTELEGK